MKKIFVGVAVALALGASQAAADGIEKRPPPMGVPPPPVYAPTWSGFYIGAGIGAGAVVHDLSIDLRDNGDRFNILGFDGIGGEGIFGTVIAGWDWQIGRTTVLGAFVDYDFSDISTDVTLLDRLVTADIDHDHSWSVGGRLGWLSSPSTLWYVMAGYTQAEFDFSARLNVGDDPPRASRSKSFEGYFVGAGVDTRLAASNWFLRLEYRFTQLEDESLLRFDDLDTTLNVDLEPSIHSGRLVLTYKFNSGWGGGWGKW